MKNATVFDFVRMCKTVKACEHCPIAQTITVCCDCLSTVLEKTEEVNDIVVRWCEEHSAKTMQSELLAVLPNAVRDEDGVVDICPLLVNTNHIMDTTGDKKCDMNCNRCRRVFWLKELE